MHKMQLNRGTSGVASPQRAARDPELTGPAAIGRTYRMRLAACSWLEAHQFAIIVVLGRRILNNETG